MLWRDDPSTFEGTHFSFQRIRSFPKPVQEGGVPILVGGHSRTAARRTARYGDGFYPLTPIVDADVSKIDFVKEINKLIVLLREECEKVGRKFDGFDIRGNTREAAMGRDRDPHSADWKGPHRFLVLRRDVGQGQIAIDCQAFLLRVATQ